MVYNIDTKQQRNKMFNLKEQSEMNSQFLNTLYMDVYSIDDDVFEELKLSSYNMSRNDENSIAVVMLIEDLIENKDDFTKSVKNFIDDLIQTYGKDYFILYMNFG